MKSVPAPTLLESLKRWRSCASAAWVTVEVVGLWLREEVELFKEGRGSLDNLAWAATELERESQRLRAVMAGEKT